jgi:hypothetical protein
MKKATNIVYLYDSTIYALEWTKEETEKSYDITFKSMDDYISWMTDTQHMINEQRDRGKPDV